MERRPLRKSPARDINGLADKDSTRAIVIIPASVVPVAAMIHSELNALGIVISPREPST